MIRLGNNIRLNEAERATLSTVVGSNANPKTTAEHDSLLMQARAAFEPTPGESDVEVLAEARLMDAVLERMLIGA